MSQHACPKCAHVPTAQDNARQGECPHCGIIYAKYIEHQTRLAEVSSQVQEETDSGTWKNFFLPSHKVSVEMRGVWTLLLVLLALWGASFALGSWRDGDAMRSFLHNADLAFHEFGHVLFGPFGRWLGFLGGSLFQCLLPLLLCIAFLWKNRDALGASVCLWWVGQNLLDVAPYIADARALALPLVGEYNEEIASARALRHDWHNILGDIGWLHMDETLAQIAHWSGSLVMFGALAWGGYWLWCCADNQASDH